MSNILLRNIEGEAIKHFQVPQGVTPMLAGMTEAELKLYIHLLAEGHRITAVEFDLSAKEIGSVIGLSEDRLTKAKKALVGRGLIRIAMDAKRRTVYTLCWPPTVPLQGTG